MGLLRFLTNKERLGFWCFHICQTCLTPKSKHECVLCSAVKHQKTKQTQATRKSNSQKQNKTKKTEPKVLFGIVFFVLGASRVVLFFLLILFFRGLRQIADDFENVADQANAFSQRRVPYLPKNRDLSACCASTGNADGPCA